MSPPPTLVWFLLLDSATGEPYKETSADKVSVSSSADVADFREAVHLKNSSILTGIDSSQLVVFKNKTAFDKRNAAIDEEKEKPMDPTESLGLLGSKEDVLLVAVASPKSSATPRESSTHFEIEIIEKAIDSSLVPAFEFSVMEFQKILGDLGSPEATSLEHWKTLLTQKNGSIYIAKVTAQTIVGLIFVYEKTNCTRHIWLTITAEKWRRHGVMKSLLDFAIAHLPEDIVELTVNTCPKKFPNMPKFLVKQEFTFCELKEGKNRDIWHAYSKRISRQ